MNTVVTSKEEILKNSRVLMQQQGWAAVSIRSVAAACGVSVGSIYNYFDSKADLMGATIESVWREIFHQQEDMAKLEDTQACIRWIYERMQYGCKKYPGFFALHPLGLMHEEKSKGKQRMQQAWGHILDGFCSVLKQDSKIRPDAFDGRFTAEKFAGILFSLIVSAMLREDFDSSAVLEVVRRTLY